MGSDHNSTELLRQHKMLMQLNLVALILLWWSSVILGDSIFSKLEANQAMIVEHFGSLPVKNMEIERSDKAIFDHMLDIEIQLGKGRFPNGMKNTIGVKRVQGKSKLGRVTSSKSLSELSRGQCEYREKRWNDNFWGGFICDCFECCQYDCSYAEAWEVWNC